MNFDFDETEANIILDRNGQFRVKAQTEIADFNRTFGCDYGDEDFDTVVAACPVPLVMAGGKKLPELDALTMAARAIEGGAAGVDMGRNIFQSAQPVPMLRAVSAVVHEGMAPADAYDTFLIPEVTK